MRTIHAKFFLTKLLGHNLQIRNGHINTTYSGITWEKYNNGINYEEVIEDLLKDAIVVGHDITNDIIALDYTVTEFSSLVQCVYDTATNASLNQQTLLSAEVVTQLHTGPSMEMCCFRSYISSSPSLKKMKLQSNATCTYPATTRETVKPQWDIHNDVVKSTNHGACRRITCIIYTTPRHT